MDEFDHLSHPLLSQEPISRDRSDWVVLKVLNGIRSGQFRAGQRLLEDDLAETFGVSRAPVRDALYKLEALGIVERRHPKGTLVRAWTPSDRRDVLAILDFLILLSVQLAVGRMKPEDFDALDAILAQTRADQETGIDDLQQMERDSRFHLIIARASGNRWLVELMHNLMVPLQLFTRESHEYLQSRAWLRMHGDLADALRRGNAEEAAACANRNMNESRAMLISGDESQAAQNSASAPDMR